MFDLYTEYDLMNIIEFWTDTLMKKKIISFIFDFVKLRKNNIFDLYNEQRNAYLYKILIYKYEKNI